MNTEVYEMTIEELREYIKTLEPGIQVLISIKKEEVDGRE